MKYPLPCADALYPRFRTKAGWHTPYALACGYGELAESPSGERARLWMEHGVFFVAHNAADASRILWRRVETLADAHRLFRSIVFKF